VGYTFAVCNAAVPEGVDVWEFIGRLTDEPEPDPAAFRQLIDRLTARYPCVGHLPPEQTGGCGCVWGECPRSWAGYTRATNFGLLSDHISTVLPFAVATATGLGFTVFDWQTGRLYRPSAPDAEPGAAPDPARV
jgi:hypothetical protein